jgi:hypothetical protein
MQNPSWLEFSLLGLASWRTWALLSSDSILDRPRRYLARRPAVGEFLECPYCSGFWVAAAWWGAYQIWPHGSVIAASLWAIASVPALIERLSSD